MTAFTNAGEATRSQHNRAIERAVFAKGTRGPSEYLRMTGCANVATLAEPSPEVYSPHDALRHRTRPDHPGADCLAREGTGRSHHGRPRAGAGRRGCGGSNHRPRDDRRDDL